MIRLIRLKSNQPRIEVIRKQVVHSFCGVWPCLGLRARSAFGKVDLTEKLIKCTAFVLFHPRAVFANGVFSFVFVIDTSCLGQSRTGLGQAPGLPFICNSRQVLHRVFDFTRMSPASD